MAAAALLQPALSQTVFDSEVVKPVQAKLNRLIDNHLLKSFRLSETGRLDASTVQALRQFCETYSIHSGAPCPAFISSASRKKQVIRAPLSFGVKKVAGPPTPYNPNPDLLPWSHAMQVLQWLVDHSEGPISQMRPEAHNELAKHMIPAAKRAVIETNTPALVKALLNAKALYKIDMDSTGMLMMCLATIRAETGNFVPCNEGVDYKSKYNNSAYEDFDVYEPYFAYAGGADKAEALIQASRERAIKAKGASFHEPTRKPIGTAAKPTDGNSKKGDGARFKGRGLIQLTHGDTYARAGKALKINLEEHPDLLNDDVDVSAQAMVWFLADGRTLPFHKVQKALAANDLRTLREAVNGAASKGQEPAGMGDFRSSFEAGKRFIGVSHAFMYLRAGISQLLPAKDR